MPNSRKPFRHSETTALASLRKKRDDFNRRFPAHAVPVPANELVEYARREMVKRPDYRNAGVEVRASLSGEVA